MNNTKRFIGLIPILGWPILGFKRGLNSYDYNYSNNKLYKYSENPKHPLYLDKLVWGVGGIFWYLNPCTFFFVLYKEIYRLEINLRGLEDEKKTEYYNKVLF
jgi:hypothetical protein